jgi:hypothetical protein
MKIEEVDGYLEQLKQQQTLKKQCRKTVIQQILCLGCVIYTLVSVYMAVLEYHNTGQWFSLYSALCCLGVFYIVKYLITGKLDSRRVST